MNWEDSLSEYQGLLLAQVIQMGGWKNYHLHLDRSNTINRKYWEHTGIDPLEAATYSLKVKQNLVGELHKGLAYTRDDLEERISAQLERMITFHTSSVWTLVDASPDIGLICIDVLKALRERFKDKIEIKIGTQPIFGFKNPNENPDRWEIFVEASRMADFIGGLPEKDIPSNSTSYRIGYDNHLKKILELGNDLNREVHVHVDQANDPNESGTLRLIEAVRWIGSPKIDGQAGPTVWAVHAISSSSYDEDRFKILLEGLKEQNIGVICCPRAAISMRQLRPINAPTHNCIARILEMVKWEIPVRIGTDNIADIFIPSGCGNMLQEIPIAADALRYYNTKLWAKLGTGEEPNDMDRELVSRALYQENKIFREITHNFPKI